MAKSGQESERSGSAEHPRLSWYALYTQMKQEAIVAQQLQDKGIEVFFPCYTERRTRGRIIVQPLFPRYLFVRLDIYSRGLEALRWTPGLRYILCCAGVPARVPEEAIALVRQRMEQVEALGGFLRPRFRVGERVRIKEGPLAGLEAIFDEPVGPAARVRILVHFLGEVNKAVVDVDALEAAGSVPTGERERGPRRTRGQGRFLRRFREGAGGNGPGGEGGEGKGVTKS